MKPVTLLFLCAAPLFAGEDVRVVVSAPELNKIASAGFRLSRDTLVTLKGIGLVMSGRSLGGEGIHYYYAWILDSKTRKPVWGGYRYQIQRPRGGVMNVERTLELAAGDYEIYYASIEDTYEIFDRPKKKERLQNPDRFFKRIKPGLKLSVSGPEDALTPVRAEELRKAFTRDAVLLLKQMKTGQTGEIFFRVKAKTRFMVYALGEGIRRDGSIHDYPWIADASNERRLWSMRSRQSEDGGGHGKNIAMRGEISIPAGVYRLRYVTDTSHAFDKWNSLPPSDPHHWGVALWPAEPGGRDRVEVLQSFETAKPVAALVGVANDKKLYVGMEVKQAVNLRLLCMGEGTNPHEMSDFGWILNQDSGAVVWSMRSERSYHAGGVVKNRMVERLLRFPPGRYMLHYQTDGSHAFGSWNASPPHDPDLYGISLWLEDKADSAKVSPWSPELTGSERALAKITKVGHLAYKQALFELREDSEVRVVAMGEGFRSAGMADFGWIENDETGRVVWEMTYADTRDAGGAAKNRIVEVALKLKRGRYKVIYESDKSHAFGDWNAAPPDKPELYGISVFLK
ncbi:MAG: hypothetical protein QNK37_04295 [Acidobacteriota bacterium]|nr:hypothetical protein [Acidobacteriota bacterium]